MKKLMAAMIIPAVLIIGTTTASAQYFVKPGDSLTKIAKQQGMFYSRIIELNPQIANPNKIFIGQHINITDGSKATQITEYAVALQSQTKYVYGGNDFTEKPYKADCSSWSQHIFRTYGIVLPRTSAEQSKVGKPVTFQQLQKADLVFFSTRSDKKITHVGIALDKNRWISNLGTGKDVKILTYKDAYFQKYFLYGKRVL